MTTMNAMIRGVWVVAGFSIGHGLGCLVARPDPNHCANLAGDETCSDRYPGELVFCDICVFTPANDGCVAERPEDDACYSPCGGETGSEDDASCFASSSSSGNNEATTAFSADDTTHAATSETGSSESTTGPMPCERDEDCTEAEAPFCEVGSGECVSCDGMAAPDAACAAADPGLPLCVGGACVQCTAAAPEACMGKTPVCDDASNTCVPCTAHAQCAGGAACNLYIGACLPADRVFEIGGATPDFPNLSMAFDSLDPDTETTLIVHPGMPSYDEAVTVDGGRVVAFLAADIGPGITPPGWVQTSAGVGPQLMVTTGATVLLDGLRLSSNTDSLGLHIDGGQVWMDRSRIVANAGGGIVAENGAELVMRNCFVGGADNSAAVDVDGATARITFSTLGGGTINAAGLSCTAPDVVDVRSSIIVALGIMATGGVDVACSMADISHTATETGFVGTGNVAVGELPFMTPDDWFVNYGIGDFHLQNDGLTLFADIAQWQTGDPPIDIDGDPRSTVDGTPDFAGADVPQ